MSENKSPTNIPLNMSYQILSFKTKLVIASGVFTIILALLGVTGTILNWSGIISIILFIAMALSYWVIIDRIIETKIDSDKKTEAREQKLEEIRKDIKYIIAKMEGNSNGRKEL